MPDLTLTDVRDITSERDNALAELHHEMELDELMLEATAKFQSGRLTAFLTGFPDGYQPKIPPTMKDVIDIGVSQIVTGEDPVVVLVQPPEGGDKTKSEYLEKFDKAILHHSETFSWQTPQRTFLHHTLAYGLGTIRYPLYDRYETHPFLQKNGRPRKPRNAAERLELRKWDRANRNRMPFSIGTVHPRNALFDIHHPDDPDDFIESEWVSPAAYAARYPHLNLPSRGPSRTSRLITYVSPEHYGVWLDWRPLLTAAEGANEDGIAPNRTGIIWYKMARAGFGTQTWKSEWVSAIRGILRDGREALLAHITNFNVTEVLRQIVAFTPLDISGPTREDAIREGSEFSYGPGARFFHSTSVVVESKAPVQVPQVVFQQMEQLDNVLADHFGPYRDALRGGYAKETATQLRTRLSQAMAPYRQAQVAGQQAYAAMLQDIHDYVRYELDEPLTIMVGSQYLSLRPEDIPDGVYPTVDFSPPGKEQRAFEQQHLLELKQQGAASLNRILKADPDIDDVDEEEALILRDRILDQPPVLQQLAGAVVSQGPPPTPPAPGQPGPMGAPLPGEQPSPAAAGSYRDFQQQTQSPIMMPAPNGARS